MERPRGPAAAAVAPADAAAPRLRHASLSQLESLGQSIANIAPTLMPAISITVVAGLAGPGTWLAYLIATLAMMCVAANIVTLARRHPQSGSYFLYIGRNLGPLAGALAGWAMIAAYVFTAVAITLATTMFIGNVLGAIGLSAWLPPAWSLVIGIVGLVGIAGYRDITLSSRLALGLEAASIAIIIVIMAIVVTRHGTLIDPVQLDIAALPPAGILSALTFAVFSFVGFESAATLARETRDPHIAVPRAIMGSAIGVGVFFAAIAYLMVLAMDGGAAAIAASSAPFTDLTQRAGLAGAAGIVYLAAIISGFACVLASVNAASRLLFSMGRYGFIGAAPGRVHPRHRTPHVAVLLSCGLVVVASLAMLPLGALLAYGLTGTFATLGFLIVYLGACVVAPLDLRRSGDLRWHHRWAALSGIVIIGFVIIGSVWPVAPVPYNRVPWAFALYMGLGALWFAGLDRRRPGRLAAIIDDLEG